MNDPLTAKDRFEHLLKVTASDRFLTKQGLGNEVPFFICPYDQGEAYERRVTGVLIGWGLKDVEGKKAAYAELQRPRVGRLARIMGTVEEMLTRGVIEL
jgi:hypothetical protein